jgi:hypothetical protein
MIDDLKIIHFFSLTYFSKNAPVAFIFKTIRVHLKLPHVCGMLLQNCRPTIHSIKNYLILNV